MISVTKQSSVTEYRYDLKDTTKVVLQDTHFLCAMAPPGGGRNVVSPRFLRHFIVIGITPFNDDTMIRIFGTLASRYLRVSGATFISSITTSFQIKKSVDIKTTTF